MKFTRSIAAWALCIISCWGFIGCAKVKVTEARCAGSSSERSVCHHPSVHIAPGMKWKPTFWWGNLDDPIPPEWYRPGDPRREKKWYYRNPLHNFDFYVMGIADREFVRVGRFPKDVFNPFCGWNWGLCKQGRMRLPFISFHSGGFKFYCGWRERGNFGFKLSL